MIGKKKIVENKKRNIRKLNNTIVEQSDLFPIRVANTMNHTIIMSVIPMHT